MPGEHGNLRAGSRAARARKGAADKSRRRPDGNEYLSPNMVGRELGITGEAVKQWIYGRKLPATKLPNGYWRIERSDLEGYLRERREGARRRLLLVGRMSREIAERVESAGWRVLVSTDPVDAVLRAVDRRPSAVAVDISALGEGGWSAAAKLHETRGTRRIPLLLLAPEHANAGDADAVDRAMDRALAFGARGYLCGPVTGQKLVAALEGMLGGTSGAP